MLVYSHLLSTASGQDSSGCPQIPGRVGLACSTEEVSSVSPSLSLSSGISGCRSCPHLLNSLPHSAPAEPHPSWTLSSVTVPLPGCWDHSLPPSGLQVQSPCRTLTFLEPPSINCLLFPSSSLPCVQPLCPSPVHFFLLLLLPYFVLFDTGSHYVAQTGFTLSLLLPPPPF
jgi:hypothetical protein